jgi:hypothetical protein
MTGIANGILAKGADAFNRRPKRLPAAIFM